MPALFTNKVMIVNSFNIEFGYELLSAVPYAYELYKSGKLSETISGVDTEALYYFSPKHTINRAKRSWYNTHKARTEGLPYTSIHQPEQPDKVFPPYKEHYANSEYKFKKPTLCICNRYNVEWNTKPINYFNEEILDWLFTNLKKQYEIIYFPVALPEELQDNEAPLQMNDEAVAKKHNIKLFTKLRAGKSWNKTLLQVFANCEHYITMNGGYSIMASLFSGTNIIYSVPGMPETRELKHKSFWRWYPNINNVRTLHVPSYDDLKAKVQALYIDKKPCLNILVRTNRPNYLANCMHSIQEQTYENINVVLICDSQKAIEYTRKYNARVLKATKVDNIEPREGDDYGKVFPYNLYLDEAQRKVHGFIMCLDDDDKFNSETGAQQIMEVADKDKLIIWKVDFNEAGLKPSHSFGKEITLYDIAGIGLCYHSSKIQFTDWSGWKRADYRTAKKLSEKVKVVWLDEVLTGIQDVPGNGVKRDLVGPETKALLVKLTYPNGEVKEQYFDPSEYKMYTDVYFKRHGICTELMK